MATRQAGAIPTVGIIGAGQLARMTIQAAIPLAIPIRLLAASPDDSAAQVCPDVTVGSPDDPDAVAAFARGCDVVTFDHELVPPAVLDRLDAEGVNLAPSSATMCIAQDKRRQRELFAEAGLPQPRFRIATTVQEAISAASEIGYPVVLKAASGGYDGRGVWVCEDQSEVKHVSGELVKRGTTIVAEEKVDIGREYAVVVARSATGETATYRTVETIQVDGICRQIVFDDNEWGDAPEFLFESGALGEQVTELTGVVGILALELFLIPFPQKWIINEIATRPHNSGHWSIEGAATSQFEQHLRAITGLPLGSTSLTATDTVTVNVLGPANGTDPASRLADALAIEGVHVHLYGKVPRPGRKLGHVTVTGDDFLQCTDVAWQAVEALTGEGRPEGMR